MAFPWYKVNFFQEGGFLSKRGCSVLKTPLFCQNRPPKTCTFEMNSSFELLNHQVDTLSIITSPKCLQVGRKLSPLQYLRVAENIFSKRKMTSFGIKGSPKPPFLKNLHSNLLDHEVETFNFDLSLKFCMWDPN